MKNLNFLTVAMTLVLFSCQEEEIAPVSTADCNCDRVVSHDIFYMPNQQPFGSYITINDCTGVQENGNWASQNGDTEPVDGECY